MSLTFPNWVPQDTAGSREETATLLVGTAKEHDLVVRYHVRSTRGGYWISDALADLAFEDEDVSGNGDEPEPEPKPTTKKTSGNRAAKTTGTDKEQDSA